MIYKINGIDLVKPDFGLLFWMTITFLIFLFILSKFVWPPILKSLKEREEFIDRSLQSAEDAKAQMAALQADNEKLLAEARLEREQILKEARDMKEKIVADAKQVANDEGNRLITAAKSEIEKEKSQALADIKNQVATLSVEIAEKILKTELKDNAAQAGLVDEHMKQAKMN